jgi:hydroxyacylglutathione hydrolase
MRITTIRSEGLAALSYFVSSDGEAMVIDPRRDASIYYELAISEQAEITHIFETHRNEDYVTGSLELQSLEPHIEICHSNATKFRFGEHSISDGETFKIGKMLITCLSTPGHTDDSMCYALSDLTVGRDVIVLFTGDTLFVNEVGRTDLVNKARHAEMSSKLYSSLHESILPLGNGIIIHPGHGAGSVCGGAIGDREFSTIGFERSNNIWLNMSEEEFVESKVKQELTLAPYFKHCEQLNTQGPPILSSGKAPQELDVAYFESLLEEPNHRALDTRPPSEFLKQHIPGTISMSLSNMGLIAGWALDPKQNFSLILKERGDLGEAWSYLVRIGFDHVIGFLDGGVASWIESGRSVESIMSLPIDELRDRVEKETIQIVDVREPHEFDLEHIKGSLSSPLTQLQDAVASLHIDAPLATMCPSGFRSATAASILKRNGISRIAVPLEGFKTWKARGYPTEG